MFLDAIERLYEYQREVNTHLLEVAKRVSDDDLTSVIVEGQPSIRDTLFHMIDVIEVHFMWWNYNTDQIVPDDPDRQLDDYPDIESLSIYWESVDHYLAKCVDSLTSDEQLNRTYQRSFADGSTSTRILWEMMLHVINHGTQHRSEVAMMLTKLGHSPGDMEIL
ncbi:DinB family protein [Dehalococcoides mccartyi]|nr:DinB family protein [Dehalococcoides mccartyi]